MMHDNEAFSSKVIQICRELPIEYQQAILWVIEHYDYVDTLIREKEVSLEDLNEGIKYAKKNNEHIMYVLLLLKKNLHDRLDGSLYI